MRKLKLSSILIGISLVALCCVTSTSSGKSKKVSTTNRLGYVMPKYNFSIDADYSPRTARIVPGYTALTVAIANKGFHPLRMRPDRDRWKIKDRKGRWYTGIMNIQYLVPEEWARLNPRMKKLISYPDGVPRGYTQTFQIFVSGEANLAGFDRIKYYNATLKKTFTFTRY